MPVPEIKGLPRRSLRKEVQSPYFARPDMSAGAATGFFASLSEQGMKWYNVLKDREAVYQFNKGQNDIKQGFSDYAQWQRDNPNKPDIELEQFNKIIEAVIKGGKVDPNGREYEGTDNYLTNGAAQREFNDWWNDEKIRFSDRAMQNAYEIDTAQKRAEFLQQYENLLNQNTAILDESEIIEQEEEIITATKSALQMGYISPKEQKLMLRDGIVELRMRWYKAQVQTMTRDELNKFLKSESLTTEQRKELKSEWNFYQDEAVDTQKQVAEEHRKEASRILRDEPQSLADYIDKNRNQMAAGDYERYNNTVIRMREKQEAADAELEKIKDSFNREIFSELNAAKTESELDQLSEKVELYASEEQHKITVTKAEKWQRDIEDKRAELQKAEIAAYKKERELRKMITSARDGVIDAEYVEREIDKAANYDENGNPPIISPENAQSLQDKLEKAMAPKDPFSNRIVSRAESFLAQFRKDDPEGWVKTQNYYDRWYENFININKRPPNRKESEEYLVFLTQKPVRSIWVNDRPDIEVKTELRGLPFEAQMEYSRDQDEIKSTTSWLNKWRKQKKPLTISIAKHYLLLSDKDIKKAREAWEKDGYIEE